MNPEPSSIDEYEAAKEQLIRALENRVGSGKTDTITYGELAKKAGLHYNSREFQRLLDDIAEGLWDEDDGCIVTAVVVNVSQRPGAGFFHMARKRFKHEAGRDAVEDEKL